MTEEFNTWWNEDLLTENNPYVEGTAAYWAWEGWCAGVKAEREACAKVCEQHGYEHYCGNVTDKLAETIRARSNT